MKDDELTRTTLQEAAAVGAQGLVSAAIQRAVHGVDEDVYYKGMVVGSKTNYSDTLLTTLLKARVEEFRTPDAATPQVTVNIANLMPRATSYEEWLGMKGSTLAVSAANRQGTTDEPLTVEYHDTFKGLDL
jgi:hypothetical protein